MNLMSLKLAYETGKEEAGATHMERINNILESMINSLEYEEINPGTKTSKLFSSKGLKSVILEIIKNCKGEGENIVIENKESLGEWLLGNRKLLTYGYILTDEEVEERF
jgi:hypothetical protein